MSDSNFEFSNSEYIFLGTAIVIGWVTLVLGVWFYVGESVLVPLNIAVSSVLTGSLVALYFKQARISERQADVMSLQYEPEIELENRAAEGNRIYFEFKNSGPGTAIGIGISIELTLKGNECPAHRLDLTRVDTPNVHSNVLEPQESGVFTSAFTLRLPNEFTEKNLLSFSEAAKIMYRQNVDNFLMIYYVEYTNSLGYHQSDGHTYPFNIREKEYELENYFSKLTYLSTDPNELKELD